MHRSTGETHTVLGAVGVHPDFDTRDIELLDGVREVVRITQPYKLASRAFRPEGTIVDLGKGVHIGGTEVVVAAGPCAVESKAQIDSVAERVASLGAKILARRGVQAALVAVCVSGTGRSGIENDARGRGPQRIAGRERGDGPFADRIDAALCGCAASRARATCRIIICCGRWAKCASRCC